MSDGKLRAAAHDGKLARVKRLVKSGAAINDQASDGGFTALHNAAREGHVDVIEYLLNAGARIDVKDNDGMTPMHLAAFYGHSDAVTALSDRGASMAGLTQKDEDLDFVPEYQERRPVAPTATDPDPVGGGDASEEENSDSFDMTIDLDLTMLAAVGGASDNGTFDFVAPDAETVAQGEAKLMAAIAARQASKQQLQREGGGSESIKKPPHKSKSQTQMTLSRAKGIFVVSEGKLRVAAHDGKLGRVKRLLRAGVSVDDRGACGGFTALHNAARGGHTEIIRCLLDARARIDVKDNDGMTPLHLAAFYGHTEAINLFASRGASMAGLQQSGAAQWDEEEPEAAEEYLTSGEVLHMSLAANRDKPADVEILSISSQETIQAILERIATDPPKLSDVLNDRILKVCFRWHMISRYAPEHFLFLDMVDAYVDYARRGDVNAGLACIRETDRLFCSPQSVFELNLKRVHQQKVSEASARAIPDDFTLDVDFFRELVVPVLKDLSGSLQSLWSSQIFLSFVKFRDLLETIHNIADPSNVGEQLNTFRDDYNATTARIREAYKCKTHLVLRRVFQLRSRYTYEVCASEEGTKAIGFAKEVGDSFHFFDAREELVLKVPCSVLLRSPSDRMPRSGSSGLSTGSYSSEEAASSFGCCAPRPRAPSMSVIRPEATASPSDSCWFLVNDKVLGPVDINEVKMWWKYHVIDANLMTRRTPDGPFEPLGRYKDICDSGDRLEMTDPTQIL